MKKLNKRGFTLIELLAVIVILGVLLAIAIPSVSKYISTSRKSTYVSNALSYVEAVKNDTYIGGEFKFPVNKNDATVVTFGRLRKLLEKGGKQSPYGGNFDPDKSFVIIVNIDTPESPRYKFYIAAIDDKGYGIGKVEGNTITAQAIEFDSLKDSNIVQLGDSGVQIPSDNKLRVYGDESEVNVEANIKNIYNVNTPSESEGEQ